MWSFKLTWICRVQWSVNKNLSININIRFNRRIEENRKSTNTQAACIYVKYMLISLEFTDPSHHSLKKFFLFVHLILCQLHRVGYSDTETRPSVNRYPDIPSTLGYLSILRPFGFPFLAAAGTMSRFSRIIEASFIS